MGDPTSRGGRTGEPPSKAAGLLLGLGLGGFNLVEGLVNHHLLGVHHVRDDLGAPLAWDVGFLVLGALLVVGGWLLHRSGARALDRGATTHAISTT